MSQDYIIRLVSKADEPFLESIIKDVMTEYGAVGEGFSIEDDEVRNMFDAYNNARSAYYVIELNGEVLGGAGIGPLAEATDDICELKKMYFRSELRGKGLGAKLMDLCLDAARDRGYKKCYLETLERMPEARGLYIKYGFKPIDGAVGCTGHFNCDNFYIRDL